MNELFKPPPSSHEKSLLFMYMLNADETSIPVCVWFP